ncbi:MAG TPA: uroporphyrinogen-III C-methyltransferase [Candidatus Binataceae bacterium]|nr:uroporphyrinogen-III C-methyltransferase [Candidatus Binataceae bacterium]
MMAGQGIVYLVGAGPGDPKLLTIRALELMRSAEVVAYDELVPQEILSLVSPQAELLAVGRRHGHGKTEYRLHPVVLERARAGRIVVRLKSGDPLIFGRGAEEAEELAEAGIPFEIVPGVSAALGAAAYAGIPLTDRRYASQVTLATGHCAEGEAANSRETVVLYMAAHRLAENLQRLIAQGRAPSTPAAYVAAATTAKQLVISGTLADLADRLDPARRSDPALVIVGEVVRLRDRIRWFGQMPLRGRRVLVARARPGLSKIAAQLRVLGAHVVESPRVSVEELDDYSALDQALAQLHSFDRIAFCCVAGVHAVARRFSLLNRKLSRMTEIPVLAIGRDVAKALEEIGISPTVRLDDACGEAVAENLANLTCKRLLLVTSVQGQPGLQAKLEALGATVRTAPVYKYSYESMVIREELPELIVLPNSSATHLLLAGEGATSLTAVQMIAIGSATETAARRHGAKNVSCRPASSIESAVSNAIEMLGALGLSNREVQERAKGIS